MQNSKFGFRIPRWITLLPVIAGMIQFEQTVAANDSMIKDYGVKDYVWLPEDSISFRIKHMEVGVHDPYNCQIQPSIELQRRRRGRDLVWRGS